MGRNDFFQGYRRDIDGLRAIAVLPVVLYHFGLEGISGGFLGVDVFFVISGFLISGIIFREVLNEEFSIVNFYERRFRRILPALISFLTITTVLAIFLYSPLALIDYGKSLLGVATFTSNFVFYSESGYFDVASEMKPLIHTWSLAVEEQFYIFFPVLMLLIWRFSSKFLVTIMFCLLLLSLVASEYASLRWPSANFYFILTRGWELLAGVMTMLALRNYNGKVSCLLATLVSTFALMVLFYPTACLILKSPIQVFTLLLPSYQCAFCCFLAQ
ncbi:acyltransferase family protein [Thalassolituus sp. UBA3500]|uniref:acyltransferase family protein n=1 Tax=Thalassolituus sp. UBA3500 TaxID=1947664 RepID=UPI000C10BF61|nr:acyltransferase [Thalassolituus sp. UBA3500]MBN56093.1 hypothetical protein [Oceanospirillaceae bacterium]|tara:strand:- start:4139 stop:4957 length:819 start_codon:yes stop_codon:yes gene_type:complete